VQPVVEFVGGEEAAFVEQFAEGGEGDGIAGTITAKPQQAARSRMLEHEVRRLGRFGKAESFKKCPGGRRNWFFSIADHLAELVAEAAVPRVVRPLLIGRSCSPIE